MSQLYPMGLAVVNEGRTHLHASDNPYTHIREAQNMEGILRSYLSSEEGKRYQKYVGKDFNDIKAGAGDLGKDVVAGYLDLEKVVLSNYDGKTFQERVGQFATNHQLSSEEALEYVLCHELAHAAGYKSETKTEGFIKTYFEREAFASKTKEGKTKYAKLAGVAAQRERVAKD